MSSDTYRAAVVRDPRGPDSIEIIDVPVVEPGRGQVSVRIAGAAVNPVDLGVASGRFHEMGLVSQPDHTGLGWDFAGVVDAVGAEVGLTPGTHVAGVIDGFDRDFGSHAEKIVVPAHNVAPVPDGLDLLHAATVPLNALAADQIVDLLGDAHRGTGTLLVTGAAGAVGANVVVLARAHGWQVTGLARPGDEDFLTALGAEVITSLAPGWDAVVDAAAMQEPARDQVRDGGTFVGVQPAAALAAERGIETRVVVAVPDGARLGRLLDLAARGHLPTRVHGVLPLERVRQAYRVMSRGSVRGRVVLRP